MLLLLLPLFCSAQTIQLEEAFLNTNVRLKKWNTEELADISRGWKNVKEIYPLLPFDTVSKRLHSIHVVSFLGVSKEQAFRRVKEWGALNFRSLESVIDYEDASSGKIVMEGWTRIYFNATKENWWGEIKKIPQQRRLLFSMIVTVKEGKAKVEFTNMEFKVYEPAQVLGSVYVPEVNRTYSIEEAFPLMKSPPDTWEGAVNLMKSAMSALDSNVPSLERYIRYAPKDYDF